MGSVNIFKPHCPLSSYQHRWFINLSNTECWMRSNQASSVICSPPPTLARSLGPVTEVFDDLRNQYDVGNGSQRNYTSIILLPVETAPTGCFFLEDERSFWTKSRVHPPLRQKFSWCLSDNQALMDIKNNFLWQHSSHKKYKSFCQLTFFMQIKAQQILSRTSAATYLLMEPHWIAQYQSRLAQDCCQKNNSIRSWLIKKWGLSYYQSLLLI